MTQNSNGHQAFNPSEHFIQLKTGNKLTDYLPVQWRLVWFREQCPQGTIDTEEMVVDLDREVTEDVKVWNDQVKRYETVTKHGKGYARFKATVTDGKGGRATATKCENAASFADFIEKAETGAVGLALAMLGFGTQFTADELEEQHRIVDTPTMPPQRSTARQQNGTSDNTTAASQPTPVPSQSDVTPQQTEDAKTLKMIMAECRRLGIAVDDATWSSWKKSVLGGQEIANKSLTTAMIAALQAALNEFKQPAA